MASAHSRSDTRGRPPPKRWVFTCSGSNGSNTAHNSSEMRNPVVVRLFGVRSRSRFLVACLFIPPILPRFSGYSDRHLVWSDGQPYDARDVDYSWKLWANPRLGTVYS